MATISGTACSHTPAGLVRDVATTNFVTAPIAIIIIITRIATVLASVANVVSNLDFVVLPNRDRVGDGDWSQTT